MGDLVVAASFALASRICSAGGGRGRNGLSFSPCWRLAHQLGRTAAVAKQQAVRVAAQVMHGGSARVSVGVRDVWLVIDGMFEDAEVNNPDGALWGNSCRADAH